MKTDKELLDIAERIYWAVEHGNAAEAISELRAVQATDRESAPLTDEIKSIESHTRSEVSSL
jgi:hypothetical protein